MEISDGMKRAIPHVAKFARPDALAGIALS
jgi:hypothetical protein